MLIPSMNGFSDILLSTEQITTTGIFTQTAIPPSNLPSCAYYLVLDFDGEIIVSILLKL
jgi:hypothetical protein